MELSFTATAVIVLAVSLVVWLIFAYIVSRGRQLRGAGAGANRHRHLRMLYFTGALAVQAALFAPLAKDRLRGGGAPSDLPADTKAVLRLSLQWTPGLCYGGVDFRGRHCTNCYRTHWTIHGLWGTKEFCDEYEPFSESRLNVESMRKLWPSCLRSDESFWSYEWQKHGTCFRDYDELNSMAKYFQKTLELTEIADISRKLASQSISPSSTKTISLSKFEQALEKAHGAFVFVNCDRPRFGKSLVTEIHICYDRRFRPRDCTNSGRSRCEDQIFYEEVPSRPAAAAAA